MESEFEDSDDPLDHIPDIDVKLEEGANRFTVENSGFGWFTVTGSNAGNEFVALVFRGDEVTLKDAWDRLNEAPDPGGMPG